MDKIIAGDPETRSADILAENLDRLKALFPEAFTEGKVDFDVLRQLLGDAVDDGDEKYGLNWHGKRRARQLALTPSTGTLRPCPEDSVNWDTTQNLMIEGDNLEVLKLLQKSYAGKVQLIYIDPPYNTGKDFIYPDNYRDSIRPYLEYTGQADGSNGRLSSNTEASGRFHTHWLNMLYPRLRVARNLLAPTGAIFLSIDDGELSNLKAMLNEIFGEENFVAQIEWQKRYTRSNNTDNFTSVIDHILLYQKSEQFTVNLVERDDEANARFTNPDDDPRGPWKATPFLNQVSPEKRPNLCYPITNPYTGQTANPTTKAWRYERAMFERLLTEDRLWWGSSRDKLVPDIKTFLSEVRPGMTPINFWGHKFAGNTDDANREIKDLLGEKVFDTPKPIRLIHRMIEHACKGDNDIVLDFFSGSASTGDAVLRKNLSDHGDRRFILVQIPERIGEGTAAYRLGYRSVSEIGMERIRQISKRIREENQGYVGDLGFRVFKLDNSNVKVWDPRPDDLEDALLSGVEHIEPSRTEQDILYELVLKLGLDLCMPIETRTVAGNRVYSVGVGTLIACLVEVIASEDAEPLAEGIADWHDALAPAGETTVIFRDSAFADDVAKTNLAETLKQRGLGNVRSL